MKRNLRSDLEKLEKLAFRRIERCGLLVKRFHQNKAHIRPHPEALSIWKVYDWLLSPFSLWPIDFEGFSRFLLDQIESRVALDEKIVFMLRMLDQSPDQKVHEPVRHFEHTVENGNYDHLLIRPEKFAERESALLADQKLFAAWTKVKSYCEIKSHQNSRGVIRRRMSQERNFRSHWEFDWSNDEGKFSVLFDVLCHRWRLYGMQNDKPLLLKVSVNPTPHGTMILIPRELSLDPVRDLDWKTINRLHRSHGTLRQGPKWSINRIRDRQDAPKVKQLWDEAGAQKLRGQKRYDHVYKAMRKSSNTDQCWVIRMLRLAKKMQEG
jgi:hypothetical protein